MLDVAKVLATRASQVEFPNVGILLQRFCAVVHHDAAAFDQIAVRYDFEGRDRVLLDQRRAQNLLAVRLSARLTRRRPTRAT